VPPGEWVSVLGGPGRSAYADAHISDHPAIEWRKGIDRGLAVPLQIHGDLLVATTTGRAIIALNAGSGLQYWSRRYAGPIAGTVLRRDDLLFLATGDRENRVHAVDIRRGRGRWSKRVAAIRVEPILLDSSIVVASENGLAVSLSTLDGSELWRTRLGAPPAVAPVLSNGMVFVATSDTLFALDRDHGGILHRLTLAAAPSAAALELDGHLLFTLSSGDVIAVSTGGVPAIEWNARLTEPSVASPVRIGTAIYVLDRSAAVWRVDRSGAVPVATLGGAASGSITAVGDRLVVGRLDGAVFILDGDGSIISRVDLGDSVVAPAAAGDGALYVPLLRGDVVKLK